MNKVKVQMLEPVEGIRTIDTTASKSIAKPIVGCCTSMNELIQWCILNAFNVESQDGTKYVAIDYEEMQSQLDYFVKKEKEQLVDAFDNGQANWDAKCQDYKDGKDYYSKTFKKSIPVNLDFKDNICEGCGNYNMQCTCYEKSKDDHFNGIR